MSEAERALVRSSLRDIEEAMEQLRSLSCIELTPQQFKAVLMARLEMAGATGRLTALSQWETV